MLPDALKAKNFTEESCMANRREFFDVTLLGPYKGFEYKGLTTEK